MAKRVLIAVLRAPSPDPLLSEKREPLVRLRRLARLKFNGRLTDGDYDREKQRILSTL